MNFFPQPCIAPSESARLGAKQGHATSAKHDRFSASSFLKFQIPRASTRKRVPQPRGAFRISKSNHPFPSLPRLGRGLASFARERERPANAGAHPLNPLVP